MADRLYLPVDVFRTSPPRGLPRLEKLIWVYLHNTRASSMSGLFSFVLKDIAYFLEESEEDISNALHSLDASGAIVLDDNYIFLPGHPELTGANTYKISFWRKHLRSTMIEYRGTNENRAWRAFHKRFEEKIADAIAGEPEDDRSFVPENTGSLLDGVPKTPIAPDDRRTDDWTTDQRPEKPLVSPAPAISHTPAPHASDRTATNGRSSMSDPVSRLMKRLEDGRPDEFLPGGMLRAKSTNLERGWMVELLNGYGEERVQKAIDEVYGRFKTATKEKIEASLNGVRYSYYDDDRTTNGTHTNAVGAPAGLKLI